MNMEPKTEPWSTPDFHSTNPNNNLEDKSVHDLVMVLRGTCQWENFDRVEAVLESRDIRLREENQKLQQDFEMERLKLKEQLDMEILSRLHAEFEFRKREEICAKGKKVQESYEALLKEVKVNILADRKTNEELQKKNNELEVEIKNLKEKLVDGSNEVDLLRTKIVELEDEVLELKKLKKKWEEDDIELAVLRKMIGELQIKVLELTKSKENAMVGLKIKIGELEETVKKNFVDHFEEKENVGDDEFRNGIVDEADPLPRNKDSHHTLGVASKDAQGASSAGGNLKLENEIEIINHDDDDDQSMSRGVHEKNASFGITVKSENPSSPVATATQQKSNFSKVDMFKRKFSFSDYKTSISTSSYDSSFFDNLAIRSDVKKKKI